MKKNGKMNTFLYMGILLIGMVSVFHPVSAQMEKTDPLPGKLSILNFSIAEVQSGEATVIFETTLPATPRVHYGVSGINERSLEYDSDYRGTRHHMVLTGLKGGMTYHVAVGAADGRQSTDLSDKLTFSTPSASGYRETALSTALPAIEITYPDAGAVLSGKIPVTIATEGAHHFREIAFSVDGVSLFTDREVPFEYEVDTNAYDDGSHLVCVTGLSEKDEKNSQCVSVLFSNTRSAAPFRFVAMGDTRSNETMHRNTIDQIRALNPKPVMIFNTGDLTASGSTSEWDQWKKVTDTLGIDWNVKPPPYIGAYGNHDGANQNWQNYLVGQQSLNDGKSFYIGYGNALFIVLDSQGDTSAQWLEETLKAEGPKYAWKFAFWHHPPYPFGDKSLDSSRRTWGPVLQKYGVQMIFTGHAHYYTRSYPMLMDGSDHPVRDDEKGIIQIISGGAAAPLYSVSKNQHGYGELMAEGESDYHYCVIDVSGDSLTMTVKRLNGQILDSVKLNLKSPDPGPEPDPGPGPNPEPEPGPDPEPDPSDPNAYEPSAWGVGSGANCFIDTLWSGLAR